MNRNVGSAALLSAGLLGFLLGCQSKPMDMTPPPRPMELDRLDAFVGKWEGTGECKMADSDQVMKMTGSNTIGWEADRSVLLERGEGSMGADTPKHYGMGVWSWDRHAKTYCVSWFDNFGGASHGTSNYDEKTGTWHMKFKGRNPMSGEKTTGEGTMRMPDRNTMEWTWTEWDSWGLKKLMEMKGTSRRKP